MSSENLENLVQIGELERRSTTPREVSELLGLIDEKLADCQVAGLSPDSVVSIAHFAVIGCARIALAACGYRASSRGHHETSIQSLQFTVGVDSLLLGFFVQMMRKRHVTSYSKAGEVSPTDAQDMVERSKELRRTLEDWLRVNHPNLLPDEEGSP